MSGQPSQVVSVADHSWPTPGVPLMTGAAVRTGAYVGGAGGSNVATTWRAPPMPTVQVRSVPVQSPDQPTKTERPFGDAVSSTSAPWPMSTPHSSSVQSRPPTSLVTRPDPSPTTSTTSW